MLHPYKDAEISKIQCQYDLNTTSPAKELMYMLSEVNGWLEGALPYVQSTLSKHAVSVYVIYRNVTFSPDDFLEQFGVYMARINSVWAICAYGTAKNHESVKLMAVAQKKDVQLIKQSISGKCSDTLNTLCFQIDCFDNETAQRLARLLYSLNCETNISAQSHWQDAEFLKEQRVFVKTDPQGMFCYAAADEGHTTGDLLFSLEFEQKTLLWTAFLKDKFDPAEFEWLTDEISSGTLDNRLEWELALLNALEQLGFNITNGEKTFELYDAGGKRLYFGADGGKAAERAFLKILFPLNY